MAAFEASSFIGRAHRQLLRKHHCVISLQSARVLFQNCDCVMTCATLDGELLSQLSEIPEVGLTGFTVREGLAGGVTVLKGGNYFGSWRVAAGELVWVHANLSEPSQFVASVDEAVRHTLLLILRNLETGTRQAKPVRQSLAS